MQLFIAQLPIVKRTQQGASRVTGFHSEGTVVPAPYVKQFRDAKFVIEEVDPTTPLANAAKIMIPTPLAIARNEKELDAFNAHHAREAAEAQKKKSPAQLAEVARLSQEYRSMSADIAKLQAQQDVALERQREAAPKHFPVEGLAGDEKPETKSEGKKKPKAGE